MDTPRIQLFNKEGLLPEPVCRICGCQLTPGNCCPNCYGHRCTRCGRPLLTRQSVAFAATENFHIGREGCKSTADLTGVAGETPTAGRGRCRTPRAV